MAFDSPDSAVAGEAVRGLTTLKPRHTQMYSVAMSGHVSQHGHAGGLVPLAAREYGDRR